jgi:hypothetical protein
VLVRLGNRRAAIVEAERLRELLHKDLGVDPLPETEEALVKALGTNRSPRPNPLRGSRFPNPIKPPSSPRWQDRSDELPGPFLRLRGAATAFAVVAVAFACARAQAGPYVWDQDEDGLDDRMETVQLLGYRYAFVDADTLAPLRFQVEQTLVGNRLLDVRRLRPPADQCRPRDADRARVPVLHRLGEVPAVRSVMTFAQASLARNLAGVERIEVVPVLYPALHDAIAALGVRDPSQAVFPTWETFGTSASGPPVGGATTATGQGEVIAILDTGINDATDGGYPGHEALVGRVLGGADFTHGDSLLDTPNGGSVNPSDHGGVATKAHATHVAGSRRARAARPATRAGSRRRQNWSTSRSSRPGPRRGRRRGDRLVHREPHPQLGRPRCSLQGIDVINLSLSSPT